jgi:hypothetical protein
MWFELYPAFLSTPTQSMGGSNKTHAPGARTYAKSLGVLPKLPSTVAKVPDPKQESFLIQPAQDDMEDEDDSI